MSIGLGPHLRMVSLGVLAHWCPACDRQHLLHMGHRDSRALDWDHNQKAPSFDRDIVHDDKNVHCHYFIRAGRVEFLADCSHAMANRSAPLPAYPHFQP